MAKHSQRDDQSTDDENRDSVNATGPVAKGAYDERGDTFRPEMPDNTADNSMGQVSTPIVEVVSNPHD